MTTAQDTVTAAAAYLDSATEGLAQVAAALKAIEWGQGTTLPVANLDPLAAVQLDKALPVEVAASVSTNKPATDDGSVDWTVVGVAAEHFDGGSIPSGTIPIPKGEGGGQARIRFAKHAGAFFRAKANVVISRPLNLTLGVASAGFDISGGTVSAARPSGLPWESGVCTPSNDLAMIAQIDDFAAARGRKADVVNVKSNGNNLMPQLKDAVAHKGPIYAALADRGIMVSQVLDMIPDQEPDGLNRAVKGDFDRDWKDIALMLASYRKVDRGFYARIMHEIPFTMNWGPDKGGADLFKAAWRRAATVLKANCPGVQTDWNWLRSPGQFSYDQLYPGDDVVDVIGLDPYGNEDGLTSDAAFAKYAGKGTPSAPAGPAAGIAYARHRGKKFGWAEWATTNTKGPHTDRDSAAYIRGMLGLCRQNADICAYEIYFHINDKGSQGGGHNHLLFGPDANSPDAAAEYKRLMAGG